jgi:3-phenylpropionate/trans-cinnamate dioxygenase ferredoxin subunit
MSWFDVAREDEFPEGARRLVRSAGREIALFHLKGRYYAIEDSCPHAGGSLVLGKLDGTLVTCRAHGLRFDLATGCMPVSTGLRARTFPVRLHEGRIQIDLTPPADAAGGQSTSTRSVP